MRCFNHSDVEAVGLCKHCSRGLCRECAVERAGGLSCRGPHEEIVDAVSNLVSRNVRLTAGSTSTLSIASLVYWAGAAIFVFLLIQETSLTMRLLFGVMAAIMVVCGLAQTRALLSRKNK